MVVKTPISPSLARPPETKELGRSMVGIEGAQVISRVRLKKDIKVGKVVKAWR